MVVPTMAIGSSTVRISIVRALVPAPVVMVVPVARVVMGQQSLKTPSRRALTVARTMMTTLSTVMTSTVPGLVHVLVEMEA